jgi:hypothetical protein
LRRFTRWTGTIMANHCPAQEVTVQEIGHARAPRQLASLRCDWHHGCSFLSMMVIGIIVGGALLVELCVIVMSPLGSQDDKGFRIEPPAGLNEDVKT